MVLCRQQLLGRECPMVTPLAVAEARIKKLIEHHRLVCNEICGNCDDFECPARFPISHHDRPPPLNLHRGSRASARSTARL